MRRLDAVNPPREQVAVARIVRDDRRAVGEGDDHRQVVGVHRRDDLLGVRLGPVKAGRRHVGGAHARRVVDREDKALALPAGTLDPRTEEREHRQQDGEQLQEQEQVPPQALKEAVDVQVLEASLPEQRARDLDRTAPELEEVKRDDPDGDAREDRPGHRAEGRRELHREFAVTEAAEVHASRPRRTAWSGFRPDGRRLRLSTVPIGPPLPKGALGLDFAWSVRNASVNGSQHCGRARLVPSRVRDRGLRPARQEPRPPRSSCFRAFHGAQSSGSRSTTPGRSPLRLRIIV